MSAIPAKVLESVNRKYPRMDPEWLQQCYDWIQDAFSDQPGVCDPTTPKGVAKILLNINDQVMKSDLADSMRGPGLSALAGQRPPNSRLLVQIVDITDVGLSAFNLKNTRATRIERVDLTGLGEEQQDGDPDEGPVPNYQRSILRFVLSDGIVNMPAIEYRKLVNLKLGETPLGYKMHLKDVIVRNGIIFLDPATVDLVGHHCDDLEEQRDAVFLRGLQLRLGEEPDEEAEAPAPPPLANGPGPPPPPPAVAAPVIRPSSRAPSVAPPQRASSVARAAPPIQPVAGPSRPVQSPYFAKGASAAAPLPKNAAILARERLLSPARSGPIQYDNEDNMVVDDEDEWDDPDMLDMMNQHMANPGPIRKQPPQPPPPPPSSNKKTEAQSSDYEFDEFDPDEIAKIESQHLPAPPIPRPSESASSSGTSQSSSLPQARVRASQVPMEVIEIGDSSDEKENVRLVAPPVRRVPTRTRPRTKTSTFSSTDIIEISD